LVRKTTVTPIPEDSGSNPLHGHEPGILMTKKAYEVVFYIGDPDMIMWYRYKVPNNKVPK
jgi:hypothetical protein